MPRHSGESELDRLAREEAESRGVWKDAKLAADEAWKIARAAVPDPGIVFEDRSLKLLATVRTQLPAEFERLRAWLKEHAKGVRLAKLDVAIDKAARERIHVAREADHTEKVAKQIGMRPKSQAEIAALLDDVHAFIGRFIAYPSEHAHVAHTLWIAHAHMMPAWETTPRLAFLSPEPESGKSRGLELSAFLVPRAVESISCSVAYLIRKISTPDGPSTILYDEVDTVFGPKAKGQGQEEIRALLNAGHRRGATIGRCRVTETEVVPEELPAFCAVALAGIGDLPDTVLSRCVVIAMRRRAPKEKLDPFRRGRVEKQAEPLRERLDAWGADVSAADEMDWPDLPESIVDRNADVWEPLLTVAKLAGGDWPERASCCAVTLVTQSQRGVGSIGIQLLRDMRTVLGEASKKSTTTILDALHDMEESPWGMIKGQPLTDRGLASRLRKYGIRPKVLRIGELTVRGYEKPDFIDAWERYLPAEETPLGNNETSVTA